MHDYTAVKTERGNRVSQTIDSPIMVFDFWELSEVFAALFIILIFGVVFYSWGTMFLFLILGLGVAPVVRSKNNKGVFFHWAYHYFGVSLPGIMNPKGRRKFSD